MNSFLLIPLACCVAMAASTALVGFFFPASRRPWWHALERTERPQSSTTTALTVVETTDRRCGALPFVGRDRRKAAQAAEARRRDGTGG
jgi:hypothetical protein